MGGNYFMDFKINNIYEDLEDIQFKLINFSIDNIKWSCIFSGMGIINPLTEKEIDSISKIFDSNENTKLLLSNYVPIQCIYNKGNPSFTEPPPEILNPGMYMWDFSSFNKNLSIEAQSYAILCLCNVANLYYRTNTSEGYIMIKTARRFYDFMSTYLRNADGLFVSGQDKTKNFDKKLKIKIDDEDTNLFVQIIAFEAILNLHNLTSKETYREYHTSKSKYYLMEALNLFKYLYDNYNLFLDLNTKELSQCVSSLTRCVNIIDNNELNDNIKFIVSHLCAELEARVKITGEVEKDCEDTTNASLITHFRASTAMLEGYQLTNLNNFMNTAINISTTLQDLYDSSIGLFVTGNHKSINYSISDVSEIIKYFILLKYISNNSYSLSILKEFYHYSIEKTSIIQAIAKNTIKIQDTDYFLEDNIPLMDEINKAPVFLKNFKLKLSKKTIEFETSKFFCSESSLYASYMLLYYLNLPSHEVVKEICSED
jgi:hypothetical protein